MSESSIIELANVTVQLPAMNGRAGRKLFTIPSLKIQAGSHRLIHGASGSGKTTLLHLIAGLLIPDTGSVEIDGQRLSTLTDNERCELRRRKIGLIFQKLNLLDHLTTEENILLGLHQDDSETRTKVRQALDRVQLKDRYGERCAHLSLGEQQRVAVARLLAQAPEILLADEPTSSLDGRNCRFVMDELLSLSQGKTLIVVSHDERIFKYFDQVTEFGEIAR